MKKVMFKVAVLGLALGYTFTGVAKDNPTKNNAGSRIEVVTTQKENVYKLYYAGQNEGSVKVHIYNPQGELMYTDYVNRVKAFNKFYDFSGMVPGTYTIEVEGTDGKVQKALQYVKAQEYLHVDVSTLEKGKYNLQVERGKLSSPVVVVVYDEKGQSIYQDNIDVNYNFSRVYDFSKSFEKAAAFEVTTEGTTVRKEIR